MKILELDNGFLPINVPESEEDIKNLPTGEFALGREGLFIYHNNQGLKSFRKVDNPDFMELGDRVDYTGDKIDIGSVAVSYSIFKKIFEKSKTEAHVSLYKSRKGKNWYIRFPQQHFTAATVTYEFTDNDMWWLNGEAIEEAPEEDEITLFGTLHSHASMAPFFSGTDDVDQREITGLHLVIGHLDDKKKIHMKARVCGDGVFRDVETMSIVESGSFKVKPFTLKKELLLEERPNIKMTSMYSKHRVMTDVDFLSPLASSKRSYSRAWPNMTFIKDRDRRINEWWEMREAEAAEYKKKGWEEYEDLMGLDDCPPFYEDYLWEYAEEEGQLMSGLTMADVEAELEQSSHGIKEAWKAVKQEIFKLFLGEEEENEA